MSGPEGSRGGRPGGPSARSPSGSIFPATRALAVLHHVWDAIDASGTDNDVVVAALQGLVELAEMDAAAAFRRRSPRVDRFEPFAAWPPGAEGQGVEARPFAETLSRSAPLWIPRVDESPLAAVVPSQMAGGIVSGLFVAVPVHEEDEIVLALLSDSPERPDPELVELVDDVASILGRVIEWRGSEAARHEAARTFELIIESAYDAFVSIDSAGTVIEWNRQSEECFGWSREEAMGQVLAGLIIPERLREAHESGMRRFLETGEGPALNQRLKMPARRRDGSEITVEMTIWPVRSGGGWSFSAFLHDVTEQEALEEERTRRQGELAQALKLARLGSWEWDIRENRITWSAELFRIFGEEPDAFDPSYEAYLARVHPEDVEMVDATVRGALESGLPFIYEPRFVRRDGSILHIYAQGELVRDEEGRPVLMRGTAQDVTERKKAELQRQELEIERAAREQAERAREEAVRAREALKRSEERYRFMTNSIPQHVWTALPSGEPEFLNRVGQEYFGISVSELTGDRWQALVHAEDLPEFAVTWQNALATGESFDHALRLLRHDGEFRWFLSRANAQTDDDGSVIRWYGTNTDIHRQKETEAARDRALAELATAYRQLGAERELLHQRTEQLQASTMALAASNRDLDQFAYAASHDLRAPLRGIGNLARFIEEDLGDRLPDENREMVRLLGDRVRRMESLIDGILTYSRAGRNLPDPEEVDVGLLVSQVVELLAPPESASIQLQSGFPVIRTARAPLEQVFLNLIQNALQHGGDPDPVVHVGWEDQGDHVRLHVRDQGPGIPERLQKRVWQIFQTLHPKEQGGTGLGLSIVKKLVERFGGTIELDSREGEGATFSFTWPREITVSAAPDESSP